MLMRHCCLCFLCCRASWQGVNVAVKLLQLPPGAGRTMTESGMFSGSSGAAGLLRAVGGWSNAAGGSGSQRDNNLMKHEHMAVQASCAVSGFFGGGVQVDTCLGMLKAAAADLSVCAGIIGLSLSLSLKLHPA